MIIDIHGHYTTAPKALETWRNRQIAGIKNPLEMPRASELHISDDELCEDREQPAAPHARAWPGVESGSGNRLTGISSMAMRQVLAELAEAYERQSGQAVAIVSVGGVDAARRVYEGEAFDFVVLAADAMEQLAAGGRVHPWSTTGIARSAVAI